MSLLSDILWLGVEGLGATFRKLRRDQSPENPIAHRPGISKKAQRAHGFRVDDGSCGRLASATTKPATRRPGQMLLFAVASNGLAYG